MTAEPIPQSGEALDVDVVRLVIAARLVQEDPTDSALCELDQAVEAFASRVPWDDEPDDCPALSQPAEAPPLAKTETVGVIPYWFLENPQGEWLVSCSDQRTPRQPIVTLDHTKAWRFSSQTAAEECRRRVLWPEWNDEFWPTEHADEPALSPPPPSGGQGSSVMEKPGAGASVGNDAGAGLSAEKANRADALIAMLGGQGELDGYAFGEGPVAYNGDFRRTWWWRAELPLLTRAVAAARSTASPLVNEKLREIVEREARRLNTWSHDRPVAPALLQEVSERLFAALATPQPPLAREPAETVEGGA